MLTKQGDEKYMKKGVLRDKGLGWLLFFYSVPSKPVSIRMKVWRKLIKAGAARLKGSVYILPDAEEHYEFLQWLVSEISGMRGEGAFARIGKIETMKDSEIMSLFDEHRANDYRAIDKALNELERKTSSIRQGARVQNIRALADQFDKLQKEFEEVRRIDFFSSRKGEALIERIKRLNIEFKGLSGAVGPKKTTVMTKDPGDYQGRIWITRKKPFIDRMASAWLIRTFIDRRASFGFIDEKDIENIDRTAVTFDIRGGEFTHSGDMCTFEVLVRAFSLKDKILRKIAEIVHDLDMKDAKFRAEEARGLEGILTGIGRSAKNDMEALEKGMEVFEMLYVSKSR
jgi:hypothetical protein